MNNEVDPPLKLLEPYDVKSPRFKNVDVIQILASEGSDFDPRLADLLRNGFSCSRKNTRSQRQGRKKSHRSRSPQRATQSVALSCTTRDLPNDSSPISWCSDPSLDWNALANNPHTSQAHLDAPGCTLLPLTPWQCQQRVLSDEAPSLSYQRRCDQLKSTLHWGQRKLLLSEIEFLTMYASEGGALVVYAGAAPGIHLAYLAGLFPRVEFRLYDPAEFGVQPNHQIHLSQECFTDDIARQFAAHSDASRPLLFISDIRTADPLRHEFSELETRVAHDMSDQQRWCEIMQPAKAMLKFRLPWSEGKTRYLDGQIYLPVWGPLSTSESRLICDAPSQRDYDNLRYCDQMFYFNTHTRVQCYTHPVPNEHIQGEGLDHCFDCTSEIHILSQYLNSIHNYAFPKEDSLIGPQIAKMSQQISRVLSRDRTLMDPQPPPIHNYNNN